jgi:hypothetical protein
VRARRLIGAAAGALILAAPAAADRGVSIDLGRIQIRQDLLPGGSYSLPTIGVRNPGSERSAYRMVVRGLTGAGREPPAAWFSFEPAELTLRPGEIRPVRVRLSIPTDATPDDYGGLIGAELVLAHDRPRAGAAAAAQLSFTVAPSNLLEAWWLKLKTFFSDHAPWSFILPAGLALVLVFWQIRRRFSFTVARRA